MSEPDLNALVSLLERSLADIAAALESAKAANSLAAIEQAMADAVRLLEQRRGLDLAPLVEAVKALKDIEPATVVVHVPPVQAPVVHVLPAAKFEIRFPGLHGQPDRVVTVERVA